MRNGNWHNYYWCCHLFQTSLTWNTPFDNCFDHKKWMLPIVLFETNILRLPHLFVDYRSNTNRALLQKASAIAYPNRQDHHSVNLFNDSFNDTEVKLLGHNFWYKSLPANFFRTPNSPEGTVWQKKRCGRPQQNGLHFTKKYVHEKTLHHHHCVTTIVRKELWTTIVYKMQSYQDPPDDSANAWLPQSSAFPFVSTVEERYGSIRQHKCNNIFVYIYIYNTHVIH